MINFLKLISRNKLALFGGILLVIIFVVSFLSPLLPLKDPDVIKTSDRFLLPFSEGYLLGTDHLGRDLLFRLAIYSKILYVISSRNKSRKIGLFYLI